MYVFHYDPRTHRFTGDEPCEFDQLEPGRIAVPGAATTKPPPPMKDGFERIFNPARDEWEYATLEALQ